MEFILKRLLRAEEELLATFQKMLLVETNSFMESKKDIHREILFEKILEEQENLNLNNLSPKILEYLLVCTEQLIFEQDIPTTFEDTFIEETDFSPLLRLYSQLKRLKMQNLLQSPIWDYKDKMFYYDEIFHSRLLNCFEEYNRKAKTTSSPSYLDFFYKSCYNFVGLKDTWDFEISLEEWFTTDLKREDYLKREKEKICEKIEAEILPFLIEASKEDLKWYFKDRYLSIDVAVILIFTSQILSEEELDSLLDIESEKKKIIFDFLESLKEKSPKLQLIEKYKKRK